MEIFFGVILASTFLYINFLIIKKDIQEKIIPNKYLWYLLILLPFWYFYWGYYGYFEEIDIVSFILQTCAAFIIWFVLFHFWKWWAGDAKYLIILSYYTIFTHFWIYLFMIWVLFIAYIFISSCIFWIKIIINKWKIIEIYNSIYENKRSKLEKKFGKVTLYKVFIQFLFYLAYLLLIFTIIRITLLYISESNLKFIPISYNTFFFNVYFILIILFIGMIIIIMRTHLIQNLFNPDKRKNYIVIPILSIILFLEFLYWWDSFSDKILYIYIFFFPSFILLRIIIGSIKYYIEYKENEVIQINVLKEWMIINRKIFPLKEKNIEYRISEEDIKYLKKYRVKEVVIMKEFWFWIFIFLWFISHILLFFIENMRK